VSSNPRPWLSVTDIQKAFYAGKIVLYYDFTEIGTEIIRAYYEQRVVVKISVLLPEPIDFNCCIEILIGRVTLSDAQVRVLSDLVQVYSKNTVQACQDIIAENGKTINLFLIYLRFLLNFFCSHS
jgi:hypothetical protein